MRISLSFLYSPLGKSKVLNWSVELDCCGNENRDHKNVWDISKVLKIFKCELTAREKVTSQRDLGPQSDIPYSASNLFTSGQKFQKGTQGTDDKRGHP